MTFVKEKNINKFATEILYRPNIVMTVIEKDLEDEYYPLLLWTFLKRNVKLGSLCLESLFHFNDILGQNLTENADENDKLFLKRYLNFNKLKGRRFIHLSYRSFVE